MLIQCILSMNSTHESVSSSDIFNKIRLLLGSTEFIYFDIDDTLLDHMQAQKAALVSVHQSFPCLRDIELAQFQSVYKKINSGLWHRYSLGEIDRMYLEKHRFEDTFTALRIECAPLKDIVRFYMDDYRNHWRWIDGAHEALQELSKHYEMGFITNGFSETQKRKAADFDLYRFSDKIIISEDVGYLKPSPEIFHHAAETAGFTGDRILYVGDSYTSDVQGGKSAGWNVAWFTPAPIQENMNEADFVFKEFKELIGYLK